MNNLNRTVSVSTDEGRATGMIVATNLVLTNFHVLHTGSDVKVNGVVATIVKADTKNDLLLLLVPTKNFEVVGFAPKVSQDEQIIILGNPLGHKNVILRGRIIDIADGKFYTDAHVFFGSSGSGVYNLKGELVGLVSAIEGKEGAGYPYGVIVPVSKIMQFLANE